MIIRDWIVRGEDRKRWGSYEDHTRIVRRLYTMKIVQSENHTRRGSYKVRLAASARNHNLIRVWKFVVRIIQQKMKKSLRIKSLWIINELFYHSRIGLCSQGQYVFIMLSDILWVARLITFLVISQICVNSNLPILEISSQNRAEKSQLSPRNHRFYQEITAFFETSGPFNHYVTLFLANFDPPSHPCHKVSHWSEPPPP